MDHVPVLLKESLEYLKAHDGGKFIDGTAGDGGHTIAILKANDQNEVLAIDWDQAAAERLKEKLRSEKLAKRCEVVTGNYADLASIAEGRAQSVDGIILDFGFSSRQIDDASRGFSFQRTGPLDMRFNQEQTLTAEKVINRYPETKLAEIIKEYGEEKFSKRIASKIVAFRKISPITDTDQVFRLIKEALPGRIKYKAPDSARRVFQALRIEVNSELENVKSVLPQAVEMLKPGGRMVIIAFHSLEDRIVKHKFREMAAEGKVKILTKKIVIAADEEIKINPRSNSAKLRSVEKI